MVTTMAAGLDFSRVLHLGPSGAHVLTGDIVFLALWALWALWALYATYVQFLCTLTLGGRRFYLYKFASS